MDTIDYVPLIPQTPPEDLTSFVLQNNAFQKEYLIYRAEWSYDPLTDSKVQCVKVTCTECEKSFYATKIDAGCHNSWAPAPFGFMHPTLTESIISGQSTVCPFCGKETTAVHVGNFRHYIDDYAYTTVITRIPVEGKQDRLALLEWQTERDIDKDGHSTYNNYLWTAWVVEERKIVRLRGWFKYFCTLSLCDLEQKKTFVDDYNKYQFIYPWDPSVLDGTTAENCKLNRYIKQGGKSLVAYLAVWRRKPNIENLIMQGFGGLVEELIEKEQTTGTYSRHKGIPKLATINWKEKRPNRMLYMSKAEMRDVKGFLSAELYEKINLLRKNGIQMDLLVQIPVLKKRQKYDLERLLEVVDPKEFWKALFYLDMQHQTAVELRDYWKMAATMEMDLNNDQVRWPRNLKAAHDRAAKQYKSHKTELMKRLFGKRTAQLASLEWHSDGIFIRACATQDEMIQEGKLLNHCVARYAEDHANGSTAILLIRKEDEPDKPWFTLELDEKNKTVRQNRGKHNCAPPEEVKAFTEKWLQWIRAGKRLKKSA